MCPIDRPVITQAEAIRTDRAWNRVLEACTALWLDPAELGTLSHKKRLAYRADLEKAAEAALESLGLLECACLWEFLATQPPSDDEHGGDIAAAAKAALARRLECQRALNSRDAQARLWHLSARHIHGDTPSRAQLLALLSQACADHERLRWYGYVELKPNSDFVPFEFVPFE
jgi:hypothetical protein